MGLLFEYSLVDSPPSPPPQIKKKVYNLGVKLTGTLEAMVYRRQRTLEKRADGDVCSAYRWTLLTSWHELKLFFVSGKFLAGVWVLALNGQVVFASKYANLTRYFILWLKLGWWSERSLSDLLRNQLTSCCLGLFYYKIPQKNLSMF